MDGSGGCCTARYVGGSYMYDVSNMDRIMLRFRPIAPKPTAGGSVSPPENGGGAFTKTGRGKRRYTRDTSKSVNSNNNSIKRCNKRKRKASSSSDQDKRSDGSRSGSLSESAGESKTMVTLPLLPETPVTVKPGDVMQTTNMSDLCFLKDAVAPPVWLSFGDGDQRSAAVVRRKRVLESWVTVESVTEAWVEGKGLGSTDEERRMNLERDTCPGFVSDGMGRVRWTNKAYRKMVGQGEGERDEEVNMMVLVVAKEKVGVMTYSPAFTCTVRVRYTSGNEMSSVTVPCDVWRMDGGGFAWRLDVEAALTLCLGR